ncbi:quinone oxidoreductase family protein [Schlesneria paludicola]|uniref:quinone oxidoreductase family protein n=1 Tax=Schlesneria paludicola TaxID=360056 RepID=UPI00029B1169|nr:zinc-binding dehydrogenase [Schlesneria paludicola]
MRALLTTAPGGWPNTSISNVESRLGQPNQVLVKVTAVGLNPADNFQIEGRYPGGPKPPFIVGRDACGVVLKGDAGGQWKPGDAVIALQSTTTDLEHGTLCEEQWIAAENLARKPTGWSDLEAAAAPLVYQTAWKALVDVGGLQPGQTVVVTGASGGVGLASVQLARAYGATVVALSRSTEKQNRLRTAGAHHVFSPETDHLKDKIFDAVKAKGVDVVVETVGGPILATSLHLLGVHGRISVVGVLAGVESNISIPALMFKRASIHGVLVTDDVPAKSQAAWTQIVELMTTAEIRPIVDAHFPLEKSSDAFEKLRGNVFGKVVVQVSN